MPKANTRTQRKRTPNSPSKPSASKRKCAHCPGRPLLSRCIHSESGNADTTAPQEDILPEVSKTPRRCTVCDGCPLRSECIHTQKGLRFLREQEILRSIPVLHLVSNDPLAVPDPPERTLTSVPPHSSSILQSTPVLSPASNSPPTVPGPAETGTSTPPSIPSPERPMLSHSLPSPESDAPSSDTLVEQSPSSPASHDTSPEVPTADDSQAIAPPAAPSKPSNARANNSNPKHGFIRGAMRGNAEHRIVRKHKRPEPVLDAKFSSKRFLESFNRLVEKCDDLAAVTGCWLFVGAQHCTALGPTVHYTSPRLSREAPEQISEIISNFNQLLANLLHSRRAEAVVLFDKLQKTEEKAQQAEEKFQQAEEKAQQAEEKARGLQMLVATYAARLGIGDGLTQV